MCNYPPAEMTNHPECGHPTPTTTPGTTAPATTAPATTAPPATTTPVDTMPAPVDTEPAAVKPPTAAIAPAVTTPDTVTDDTVPGGVVVVPNDVCVPNNPGEHEGFTAWTWQPCTIPFKATPAKSAAKSATPAGELPHTGSTGAALIAPFAALVLAIGGALSFAGRRRRPARSES
jgi:LPXTG-motif cell wall-anchored protein